MKNEYDFSQSKPNPYTKKLKKQITIRLDEDTINYFKKIATEKEIPYQSLMNLYLKDCAKAQKQVQIEWV